MDEDKHFLFPFITFPDCEGHHKDNITNKSKNNRKVEGSTFYLTARVRVCVREIKIMFVCLYL